MSIYILSLIVCLCVCVLGREGSRGMSLCILHFRVQGMRPPMVNPLLQQPDTRNSAGGVQGKVHDSLIHTVAAQTIPNP